MRTVHATPRGISTPVTMAASGPLFSSFLPLTLLESALPQNAHVNRLESALPNLKDLKPHRIILLRKRWGEGGKVLTSKTVSAATLPERGHGRYEFFAGAGARRLRQS